MEETTYKDRKWRRLQVSSELLSDLVCGRAEPARFTTAPPDLTVIGLYQATVGPGVYEFIVWSETFEPFPEGEYPPPLISFEYMP